MSLTEADHEVAAHDVSAGLDEHPQQQHIDDLSIALHSAIDDHLDSIVDAVNDVGVVE